MNELLLKRDGQTVQRFGTELEIVAHIHRTHCYSLHHALQHEGYSIEPAPIYKRGEYDLSRHVQSSQSNGEYSERFRDPYGEEIAKNLSIRFHCYHLTAEQMKERGHDHGYEYLFNSPQSSASSWTAFKNEAAARVFMDAYGITGELPAAGQSARLQLPASVDEFQPLTMNGEVIAWSDPYPKPEPVTVPDDARTVYTVEQLRELNPGCSQPITESTRTRINDAVYLVESSETPRAGDIVLYRDPYTNRLHAARHDGYHRGYETSAICIEGASVHLTDTAHTSISGGPWAAVDDSKLIYKERRPASFWMFAQSPQGGAGVRFTANVRVWEIAPEPPAAD